MSSNTPDLFASHSTTARSVGPGRVAIPRLQRCPPSQGATKERRRVQRACIACRSHKVKCSGDIPKCKHCKNSNRECIYIMPRRDRPCSVTERCVQMASLLTTLRSFASDEGSVKIGELLEALEDDITDFRQPPTSNTDSDGDDYLKEARLLFDAGFLDSQEQVDMDSLDLVDEDLHENDRSRATGFVGMNSEVQWFRTLLQRERSENETAATMMSERRGSSAATTNSEQVSSVTFYLDSEDIDVEHTQKIDPHQLPSAETAERLFGFYMDKVHDSFPILSKTLFTDQFRKHIAAIRLDRAPPVSPRWQAILNLVFAIGARYSHLVKADSRAEEQDHLIYQARARLFAWNKSTLTRHPDWMQIQVAGLLSFHYLSMGQVSRAWVVVGMALRFAYSLGLHVRNEDPSAPVMKRELLVRIWWSLYSLERQLSVITGRPSVIVDSWCSVPQPIPLSEEQILADPESANAMWRSSSPSATSSASPNSASAAPRVSIGFGAVQANSGSYFKAVVQLGSIKQNILSCLYSAGTTIRSPGEIQQDIVQLGNLLDLWLASLPSELNFQIHRSGKATPSRSFSRERMLLGFQFCGAKILLTRPCLGGIGQQGNEGKNAGVSASFYQKLASTCVEAARMQLDFFPDEPNLLFIYEWGPWWSIVHYLMQALAVVLLALSHSSPVVQDSAVIVNYGKKAVRWLRSMCEDPLAQRAYQVAFTSFELVANRLSLDVRDLWMEHSLAFSSIDPNLDGGGDAAIGLYPMAMNADYGVTTQEFVPSAVSLPAAQSDAPIFLTADPMLGASTFAQQTDATLDDSLYERRLN